MPRAAPHLDETDRKILRRLQENGAIQNQVLAEEVGLSPSPCHRRVKALEEAGIIERYVALVDGAAVGTSFLAFVEVRLERQAKAVAERFERAVIACPEVLECHFVTGEYDYVLKVAVRDLDEFHRFITEKITTIDGVANTRSVIPVKRIKSTTAVK